MESHTPVCLRAMKEERDADIGYVAGDDDEYDWYPPSRGQFTEPWHCKLHVRVSLRIEPVQI
jgi:hypothetical protein